MAKYNTFVVINTRTRKTELVTSSARKASRELSTGKRVEIWNDNQKEQTIYASKANSITPYIEAERDYIRMKQMQAEVRNSTRGIMRA